MAGVGLIGGTGPEGLGLAMRLALAGETVQIGSRRPERAADAARTVREAVAVVGGERAEFQATTGVEVLDLSTLRWSLGVLPPVLEARENTAVCAFGDGEAVVGGRCGGALVLGFVVGVTVVLVPDIRQPLEEEQREDVLLVVAGIDEPAQQRGRTPEVGFEFLLGETFGHYSHPPSVSTVRR